MSLGRSILSRFGIEMRRGEGAVGFLLSFGFFLLITFQYVAKTLRQSGFINDLGYQYLPVVYLLVALCTYPPLRLYSRYAGKVARHKMMMLTCLIVAGSMIAFRFAFATGHRSVSILFYVWVSIVFVMTVSQFWAYASFVFDPRQAKRLFGFLGAGGLLGGIAGGQVARIVSKAVGDNNTLVVAAIILLGVVVVILSIHRISDTDESRVAGAGGGKLAKMDAAQGGFAVIKSSRHLTLIMWIMILTVMVAQMVDIQFNSAVDAAITDPDPETRKVMLTAFYGNFFTWMGIAAFVFQLLFTARIHRALGVGFAMRVLPVTMAIGTIGIFFAVASFPAALLTMAIVLKVGESGLRYSLDQATRELLFLPVPAKARLKAKAYIDVFVQRGAKGLAAILLLPITFGVMQANGAGWIMLVLIVIWMFVISLMAKEYVQSFRLGLKQRSVDEAVPINVSDVTTLELLVESLGSSDSRQVIHSLNLLASNDRGNLVPPLLLYHDHPEVRLRTLEVLRDIERTDAAPLVERRLGDPDPDVRAEAIRVLACLEGQNIVELMLPRLEEADPGVRAAAVACLASHGDPEHSAQARKVLLELISDADENARVEAAKALGAIAEPEMQEQLIRLLYDRSPKVVRETIVAISRRVGRDGYNPMYLPILISLLHDRHLKQDAREALVAFGEKVIPALVHFMGAEDEPIWVRRALPKTLASIGTEQAVDALMKSLVSSQDRFLRRKLIEALGSIRIDDVFAEREDAIATAINHEMTQYFDALRRVTVIGLEGKGSLEGPEIDWSQGDAEPGLLEKLLAERMGGHLRNMFGLFALHYPSRDIWAAYRSLLSGQAALRNTALEYLDNTLTSSMRQTLGKMLDNSPLEDKLKQAASLLASPAPAKVSLLEKMLEEQKDDQEEESGIRASAIYHIYTEGVTELYPTVSSLKDRSDDPFVAETAAWVTERVA